MGGSTTSQLQVGVIGAGIAGLAAGIALSRAGHSVELFERSRFKNEVGAAIIIGPNGTRILERWGFDFEKAGALDNNHMRRYKADTTELDSEEVFKNIKETYGQRWLLFHRADLHSTLHDLLETQSPKPTIHLSSAVASIEVQSGAITLADGRTLHKDLIVIADGVHSENLAPITGRDLPVTKSPMSMYRFLQPMSAILSDSQAQRFYADQPSGFSTFYKTEVGRPGLLLNTYPCRGGSLLYCALVHPTKPKERGIEGWDSPAEAQDVIADAAGFDPAVQAICQGATDVKVYTQMWREPLERFSKGKAVLIGDAAHLMLPTHGQGASMAIEDVMALEVLLGPGEVKGPEDVPARLALFDTLRLPRVRAVQTMSNKMMGPPDKMQSEVKRYYLGSIPGPKAKTFSTEYNDFFFLYDVESEARKVAEKSE